LFGSVIRSLNYSLQEETKECDCEFVQEFKYDGKLTDRHELLLACTPIEIEVALIAGPQRQQRQTGEQEPNKVGSKAPEPLSL